MKNALLFRKYIMLLDDIKLVNNELIIRKFPFATPSVNVRKWFFDVFRGYRNVT